MELKSATELKRYVPTSIANCRILFLIGIIINILSDKRGLTKSNGTNQVNSICEGDILNELDESGYAWVRDSVASEQRHATSEKLEIALSNADSSLRNGELIYGARNLLDVFPSCCDLLKIESIRDSCDRVLGSEWGIVRGLFFDKPPGSSWSLPWHQDVTIAVENNQIVSTDFIHPTRKAGVDHLEAPTWLLRRMLTLRFHLDEMSADNGPLLVRSGSHRAGKLIQGGTSDRDESTELHCNAGDCLLMRPLLSHSSRLSSSECQKRRRVIHLELSNCPVLPGGLRWYQYRPRTNQ